MVVSMMQIILEIPDSFSLKDKRSVVRSIKDICMKKFKLSAAEIDLQGSHTYCQLGMALVSNSKEIGEKVLQKTLDYIENNYSLRIYEYSINSEHYD
jgi:uncharacterized protein YlxP (DUF503 family)